MPGERHELAAPDLDLGETPMKASLWHVAIGGEVVAGEPLLELAAGDVVVDLSAPAAGVLAEQRVAEEDPVRPGQVLAVIVADRPC